MIDPLALRRIERKLDVMIHLLILLGARMSAAFTDINADADALAAKVDAIDNLDDAIAEIIRGHAAQVAALTAQLADSPTAEEVSAFRARMAALTEKMTGSVDVLTEAAKVNTPAADL